AVVNQTWRNLDILIVDDGSTDGTLAIAKDFQKRDSRIKILAQAQNSGLIPSLNIGLDEVGKVGGGGGGGGGIYCAHRCRRYCLPRLD
ncbi:glycosyltransferase family 2 protein, partial [Neisseria gonorrhoeae]